MSSIVVTGTGLVTAAGLGYDALEKALANGQSFVRERSDGSRGSEASATLVSWPSEPQWQAMREYAGLGSQLAVTACRAALASSLSGAAAFDPVRGATVVVASDDWTEQRLFDGALAKAEAARDEARLLFSELEDTFLLRTFRWSIGFAVGSITGFQGPAVGIDCPSFGGLSGVRHALDLIASNEVDAVMLVGVDTSLRLDVSVSLEQMVHEASNSALELGQGAAALILERSSSALHRGARPLARLLDCRLALGEEPELVAEGLRLELGARRIFSSTGSLGNLFSTSALVDICLATHWLWSEAAAGRTASAGALGTELFGVRGAGSVALDTFAGVGPG